MVTGLLTSMGSVLETADNVYRTIKNNGVEEGLNRLATEKGRDLLVTNGSIVKLLSTFIIEPKIVISNTIKSRVETEKAIKLQIDLFTMLYTKAFDVLTRIHGLSSDTTFSLLSGKGGSQPIGNRRSGLESDIEWLQDDVKDQIIIFGGESNTKADKFAKMVSKELKKETLISKEMAKGVYDKEFDSITKQFINEVSIQIDTKTVDGERFMVTIPVLIKATVVYTKPESIHRLLEVRSSDKGFLARWDEWRASAITLKDLLFASSLVDEYKEKRLNDSDNLIQDTQARNAKAMSKLVSDGAVGFGKYYQMILIGSDDRPAIERILHGKLSKERVKEDFLEQSRSLSLTVMDYDYERVSIFLKDSKGVSSLSFSDLAKKSKGDDFNDLYKLVLAGRSF